MPLYSDTTTLRPSGNSTSSNSTEEECPPTLIPQPSARAAIQQAATLLKKNVPLLRYHNLRPERNSTSSNSTEEECPTLPPPTCEPGGNLTSSNSSEEECPLYLPPTCEPGGNSTSSNSTEEECSPPPVCSIKNSTLSCLPIALAGPNRNVNEGQK